MLFVCSVIKLFCFQQTLLAAFFVLPAVKLKMSPLQEAMVSLIEVFYSYSGREGDKFKLNKGELKNLLQEELTLAVSICPKQSLILWNEFLWLGFSAWCFCFRPARTPRWLRRYWMTWMKTRTVKWTSRSLSFWSLQWLSPAMNSSWTVRRAATKASRRTMVRRKTDAPTSYNFYTNKVGHVFNHNTLWCCKRFITVNQCFFFSCPSQSLWS